MSRLGVFSPSEVCRVPWQRTLVTLTTSAPCRGIGDKQAPRGRGSLTKFWTYFLVVPGFEAEQMNLTCCVCVCVHVCVENVCVSVAVPQPNVCVYVCVRVSVRPNHCSAWLRTLIVATVRIYWCANEPFQHTNRRTASQAVSFTLSYPLFGGESESSVFLFFGGQVVVCGHLARGVPTW